MTSPALTTYPPLASIFGRGGGDSGDSTAVLDVLSVGVAGFGGAAASSDVAVAWLMASVSVLSLMMGAAAATTESVESAVLTGDGLSAAVISVSVEAAAAAGEAAADSEADEERRFMVRDGEVDVPFLLWKPRNERAVFDVRGGRLANRRIRGTPL